MAFMIADVPPFEENSGSRQNRNYCYDHHHVLVCMSKRGQYGSDATWIMSQNDAMTFCSDERTADLDEGWTFVRNEIEIFANEKSGVIPQKYTYRDKGHTDIVLMEHGLMVYPLTFSKEILRRRQGDGEKCSCELPVYERF